MLFLLIFILFISEFEIEIVSASSFKSLSFNPMFFKLSSPINSL